MAGYTHTHVHTHTTYFKIKFLKDPIVNILGFVGYILSLWHILLFCFCFVLFLQPFKNIKTFLSSRTPYTKTGYWPNLACGLEFADSWFRGITANIFWDLTIYKKVTVCRTVVARGWVERGMGVLVQGYRVSVLQDEKSSMNTKSSKYMNVLNSTEQYT